MSHDTAVQIHSLWKRFGYRRVLCDVNLEVPAGICLSVFGPNGAGKSTLLRILSTRVGPTSGTLQVFGKDLRREALSARREIGVVFHESCLRNDLTLEENLRYYAALFGIKDSTQRVGRLVSRLGLESRLRDPVRTFSRGMVQRATLIRSLVHNPRLWLLDEPFTGLDPGGQAFLEEWIREERNAGRTILLITHDTERGFSLADDGIFLKDGRLAARGPAEVKAQLETAC